MRDRGSSYAWITRVFEPKPMIYNEFQRGSSYACITVFVHSFLHNSRELIFAHLCTTNPLSPLALAGSSYALASAS